MSANDFATKAPLSIIYNYLYLYISVCIHIGFHMCLHAHENKCTGTFVNGLAHGRVTWTKQGLLQFVGEWREGHREGQGIMKVDACVDACVGFLILK
jgi:hypothetical protein